MEITQITNTNKNEKYIICAIRFFSRVFNASSKKKDKNAKYDIAVKGNCDMCKKRIEKAAFAVSGVKSAIWKAENQQLSLIVNEQKTTVNQIEKAVAKVGHDTKNVKATHEDYSNLHDCCSYDRE